jgi:2-dehydro-3-deoxygalactonokinase
VEDRRLIVTVDSGTTSTRAWVMEHGEVKASSGTRGGARDVARTRDRTELLRRIRKLADGALATAGSTWEAVEAVVAFGMITSELGLEEVPHLEAPVSCRMLAEAMHERRYGDALPGPVFLVPGVRSDGEELELSDVMRGEETEVAGLLALGEPEPPFLYISTGSHTKFVDVDRESRIDWSLTTLSGELLLALQRETILADLIDLEASVTDLAALEDGARFAERVGLTRALFGARLLNRMRGLSTASCSDFLHGAVAGVDLLSLRRAADARGGVPDRVAIGGKGTLRKAYRHLLEQQPEVVKVRAFDIPLGALGAWNLFTSRRQAAPAGPPKGRS